MDGVRERARQRQAGEPGQGPFVSRAELPAELIARVARLHAAARTLRAQASRLGELPPEPPTLRGKVGALAVRLMRRSMFWLIPSLRANQEVVAGALEEQARAIEDIIRAIEPRGNRLGPE